MDFVVAYVDVVFYMNLYFLKIKKVESVIEGFGGMKNILRNVKAAKKEK